MIRNPVYAGQFYPGRARALQDQIKSFASPAQTLTDAIGIVVPHAGYVYSGRVAGAVYSQIKLRRRIVVIGPNHTGSGARFSLMKSGVWVTLLGDLSVDRELAQSILDRSNLIEEDAEAHLFEHSIEVQLPFVTYFNSRARITPIIVSAGSLEDYQAIGRSLAEAIEPVKNQVTIIASNDMTHYESHEEAKKKDNLAIEAILKLDPALLMERVEKYSISMCGYGPVTIMLEAAKSLGATKAELVRYETSGDTSGDYSSVVGYAGIVVS